MFSSDNKANPNKMLQNTLNKLILESNSAKQTDSSPLSSSVVT